MRRSWPKAEEFIREAGWKPVKVRICKHLPALGKFLIMWRDPHDPRGRPVYLHEAEAREDRRRWTVRHVMES